MGKPKSKTSRLLRIIGIIIGVIIVLLYIGLPAGVAAYTVLPNRAAVGSLPDGFEEVTLTASDGVQLAGWYRPPANGAVIILLHGAGGSRESVHPHAEMLVRHGYGVLALDLRGHGASQGQTNRYGWQGTLDAGAAVNFLQGRAEVQRIGGLGSSLGGEVLLGAASQYPQIQAIAADGATQRCAEELVALESERPLVRNFTARVMYATVGLLTGEQPPKPLLQSMIDSTPTSFLLIAGGADEMEVAFNQMFQDTLGERAELWVAPEVGHIGAIYRYPKEYEQRVIDFFAAELD